jgi:hypothetical protein
VTDQPSPPGPSTRPSGGSGDDLGGLARELAVASHALFEAGRSVQRHAPDAGDPPADRRVSDLQAAALEALRSLAGGLDAMAETTRASPARQGRREWVDG